MFARAYVAGIDAIFVQRLGAGRVIGQELVADIVEVADQRHVDAAGEQLFLDERHGGRRLVAVDGDADQFRPGAGERRDTLTVTDNRTGKTYEIPIDDGTIRAPALRDIKVSEDDFGLILGYEICAPV